MEKTYLSFIATLGVMATLALAAPALAATGTPTTLGTSGWGQGSWQGSAMHVGVGMRAPGVFGTVASISGTTLTVTSKMPQRPGSTTTTGTTPTPTTYTVDASSATVTKNNAASTLSAVSVGDMVMVQGTVSGTNVTATAIHDGVVPMRGGMHPGQGAGGTNAKTSIIQGNGEPVVGGSVTAINGSVLTITNKSNVTYTVDATSATIDKDNATSTLSSVTIGDNVLVQGEVNGSSITASSVIDQGASATGSTTTTAPKGVMGFFSGIGGFFAHLFGF